MNARGLLAFQYSEIPGLLALQGFATELMGLALLVWLLVELYRLITRGSGDFVTPIVRVGLAVAVVQSIGFIGDLFGGFAERLSDQVIGESNGQLLMIAYDHVVAKTDVSTSPLLPGLSMRLIIGLGSMLLYLGMLVVKFMLIDVLFPLAFGVVLMIGVLSVPLSLFPGVSSISGWFRNLIEVSLWPVIFQVLLALMVTTFQGLLQRTAALKLGPALGEALTVAAKDPYGGNVIGTELGVLVQFWGLCAAYILMVLMTPVVAAMVVRGTPVGIVGGVVAAKGFDLMKGAVAAGLSALGGGAAVGAATATGVAGGAGGVAGVSPKVTRTVAQLERADTRKIDRRSYKNPEE